MVKVCEVATVSGPLLVVVIPVAPKVMAAVVAVPIEIEPLALAPEPPLMVTFSMVTNETSLVN